MDMPSIYSMSGMGLCRDIEKSGTAGGETLGYYKQKSSSFMQDYSAKEAFSNLDYCQKTAEDEFRRCSGRDKAELIKAVIKAEELKAKLCRLI